MKLNAKIFALFFCVFSLAHAVDTLEVFVLRVQFKKEAPDNSLTTGTGVFGSDTGTYNLDPSESRGNKYYWQKHLDFANAYYKAASGGELVIKDSILPTIYTLNKVYDKISNNLDIRYTAKELAVEFGVSETSLKTYFRGVYGCGYAEFQQILRLKNAANLLAQTDKKVIDIALSVGYKSQPKFGAAFKERYKVSPLEYRRRCKFENKTEGDRNVLDKR